jgi:hypothetical protein
MQTQSLRTSAGGRTPRLRSISGWLLSLICLLTSAPLFAQPTPVQVARLIAGVPGGQDMVGYAVAVDGDLALVGAPYTRIGEANLQGAAYVYRRTEGGTWEQMTRLLADDGGEYEAFGESVALQGDVAVVGVPMADSERGAVYVFRLTGSTWRQTAKLTAAGGRITDRFGASVAISGNTIVVGANNANFGETETTDNSGRGAAYVFWLRDGVWEQMPGKLISSDGFRFDGFGTSVAISSANVIAVGAPGANIDGRSNQGAVYAFGYDGRTWREFAKITAQDGGGSANERFGNSVALEDGLTLDGLSVIVGTWSAGGQETVASTQGRTIGNMQGRAYIFTFESGRWIQKALLTASDGSNRDGFGFSVALKDNTAIVGAPERDAAYIFTKGAEHWTQTDKIQANNETSLFGFSVALSSNTALVGAPQAGVNFNPRQGLVYVFDLTPPTNTAPVLAPIADQSGTVGVPLTFTASATDADAGQTLTFSLEGAPAGASIHPTTGVFTYTPTAAGTFTFTVRVTDNAPEPLSAQQTLTLTVTAPVPLPPSPEQVARLVAADGASENLLGFSVAIDGNTAIVGVERATVNGNADQGAAYVFTRSGGNWTQTAKLTAADGADHDFFGRSVALSGNTAVVGAPYADVGEGYDQGAVYVFTLSGGNWTQTAKLSASNAAAENEFGYSVAIAANIILVGATDGDVGSRTVLGTAYVFTFSGGSWTQTAQLSASDGSSHDRFGTSVATDGNMALVGAVQVDVNGNSFQGAAYVFTRSGSSWTQTAKLTASDGGDEYFFGRSVALSGNTAVVGAPGADIDGRISQGATYIFTRDGGSWTQTAKLTAGDGAAGDAFGASLASAGNRVVVGASGRDAAYVYSFSSGNWMQTARLQANEEAPGFGFSVALSGNTALVGAPRADVNSNIMQGAVYVFDLAPALPPPPAALTFFRALNLNGPALTVDGKLFEASNSAPDFTYTGNTFTNQGVPLTPPTDINRSLMLRSSIWGGHARLNLQRVPSGTYEFYIYVWEDNNPATFSLFAENQTLVSNYLSGPAGRWEKLGPFRLAVTDGELNIRASGGHANLSGLEIYRVGEGATPPPVPSAYVRALNLNGPSVNVDGFTFEDSRTVAQFSFEGRAFSNTTTALTPAVPASLASLLRSSLYLAGNPGLRLRLEGVPEGTYDVYLYNWEDNNATTFSLFVEGQAVLRNFSSGPAGSWRILGPYRTAITDGALDVYTTGGSANLSGLLVRDVNSSARRGLAEAEATAGSGLSVYPVPTDGVFHAEFVNPQRGPVSVRVINLQGRTLAQPVSEQAEAGKRYRLRIDGGQWAQGMYLLQVQTAAGTEQRKVLLTR